MFILLYCSLRLKLSLENSPCFKAGNSSIHTLYIYQTLKIVSIIMQTSKLKNDLQSLSMTYQQWVYRLKVENSESRYLFMQPFPQTFASLRAT